MMSKRYTESYYTCATLSQWDEPFSPSWRPCSASTTIVLSCLVSPPKALPPIWNGGYLSFNENHTLVQSLAPATSTTSTLSLTQAQASVSPLLSKEDGEL